MRLPDQQKRQQILAHAARLFATEPFHKVRLDHVASAAGVGKGTLYVYFESKEELYLSILYEGFSGLVERLHGQLADDQRSCEDRLRSVVEELVDFGFAHPMLFQIQVSGAVPGNSVARKNWDAKRQELSSLIEATLRLGITRGELDDPHPELTALFVPGLVRTAMLYGPADMDRMALTNHILTLLRQGLTRRGEP